jgi:hypothetical protein
MTPPASPRGTGNPWRPSRRRMSAHRRLGVPGAGAPGCEFQDERIGAEAMTAEAIRVDVELELLDPILRHAVVETMPSLTEEVQFEAVRLERAAGSPPSQIGASRGLTRIERRTAAHRSTAIHPRRQRVPHHGEPSPGSSCLLPPWIPLELTRRQPQRIRRRSPGQGRNRGRPAQSLERHVL